LYGFHVEDWIYWRTNNPPYTIEKSPIVQMMGSADATLFRCPLDRDDSGRMAAGAPFYFYSYSFNCISGLEDGFQGGAPNLGFATAFSFTGAPRRFKSLQVRNPSRKMMLAEEPAVNKPWDMPPGSSSIVDDGQWDPLSSRFGMNNTLTVRHSGKAEVEYGDGHAVAVSYKQAQDTNNVVAAF
jgi:hypothetical protein